jgi:hypothetical protein
MQIIIELTNNDVSNIIADTDCKIAIIKKEDGVELLRNYTVDQIETLDKIKSKLNEYK